MAKTADVSVIVAAYQANATIARTLASIAGQTLKPKEVVIVDDGSTDATFEAANAASANMNGIELRVFRSEGNLGAGAARNRAIEEATGTYLAFLDADDEWMAEKLERSMAHMESGDYVLVGHDYVTEDGPPHHCEQRFLESGDAFVNLYRKGYIASSSVVVRRGAVIAAGGFDPGLRNAQDFDLWLALTRGPDSHFLVFGDALLRYHPGPGGIMSHTQRRLECCLTIAQRYIPDLKRRPGSALMSLWFRVIALHLEAVQAYGVLGNILGILWAAGKCPFSLLIMTALSLFPQTPKRGRFIDGEGLKSLD
ncbi:MAG: glycosyltransferase family 2 protein [Proteobacteria bacterium]|nr:glycosyltransferase family 2 protein [Pseudomonadota bacterium]